MYRDDLINGVNYSTVKPTELHGSINVYNNETRELFLKVNKDKGAAKFIKRLDNTYFVDFETTTELNYQIEGEVRVYLWGAVNSKGDKFAWGKNIASFMVFLKTLDNPTVYFHNLKFDFSYIESFLQRSGYNYHKHVDEQQLYPKAYELSEDKSDLAVSKLASKLKEKNHRGVWSREYSTIKDGKNNLFQAEISVAFKNTVTLLDSSKMFPTSLRSLGKQVGVKKLEDNIDHSTFKRPGYEPSDEELMYQFNDVEIIRVAMVSSLLDSLKFFLTRSSYAYDEVKRIFKNHNDVSFNSLFPPTSVERYKEIESAYVGGLVYVNPKIKGKHIKLNSDRLGFTLDINSLYPSIMLTKDMPIGEGVDYTGNYNDLDPEFKEKHPLYIQFFKAKFTMKKEGLPVLAKKLSKTSKGVFSDTDLISPVIKLSNVDLKHFFINYDVESIEYIRGFAYETYPTPHKQFVEEWSAKKIAADKAGDQLGRTIAKLTMNGAYGKFGESLFKSHKESYLDENDVIRYHDIPDGERQRKHLPTAIFITSYARDVLLEGAYTVIKAGFTLCYMDTDSIHFIGGKIPESVELDNYKLGAWSVDGKWSEAKFLRDKCYLEEIYVTDEGKTLKTFGTDVSSKTELDIKCAGLSDSAKSKIKKIDDFILNRAYSGTLTLYMVKGGGLLRDTPKYLSDGESETIEEKIIAAKLRSIAIRKIKEDRIKEMEAKLEEVRANL